MLKAQIKSLVSFLSITLIATTPVMASDKTIVLGQSAALDGPASSLGQGMRFGLQAAFHEINEAGGINGRKIELISYDDGYEPDRSIENTRKLIEQDNVFALIGAVGTPTSKASQPIAKKAGVPFIAPFTGAGFLRDSSNAHVINYRGSYDQETEAWIEHLTTDLDASRIAILYQDDSFGRAGLSGVVKALEKRNMSLVAEGTYKRNTTAVKSALLKIRKKKPDAVVMVGAYKPIAEFVKLATKFRMKSKFVTISFVGTHALSKELGDKRDGVIVTQVVPDPNDKSIPVVAEYQAALKALQADSSPEFVSLEGYIAGRLMIHALQGQGAELDREKLLADFRNQGTLNIGGLTLEYGPGDNQGMDKVFLSVIQADGSIKYVDHLGDTKGGKQVSSIDQ